MKVEFLAENVSGYLPLLTKVLPTHSQVPVLSNILLEATEKEFFICATDLELGIKISIPAKIEEVGAVTVPGKQFIEVISSISRGKVLLGHDGDKLVLSSGDGRVVFQTIPKEEFPSLFEDKGEKIHSFAMSEFKDIFQKLTFVASIDESRPQLTGIYITQKGSSIDFVATDGYRLSLKKKKGKIFEDGEGLILSSKLINEALFLKEGETLDMYVYKTGNQVVLEGQNVVLVGRLIEGEFPNYERVIPKSSTTKIELDAEEFLQAIRLSSVFAKESANIVHLKTEGGQLHMHSKSSGLGEGEMSVSVKQEGEETSISFNVRYLIDFLKNVTDKVVRMELTTPLEPALLRSEKDPEFTHIIMPVRVQGE